MPVQIRQLATAAADFEAEFAKLRHWSEEADHAIEELSGAADEREALLVLVGAGGLADEAELCARVAAGEDGLDAGGR